MVRWPSARRTTIAPEAPSAPTRIAARALRVRTFMNNSRDFKGDVFHQPLKRPTHRANPMRDPLVLAGKLGPGRSRLRPRARDRQEFMPIDVQQIRRKFHQTRGQFAGMIGISKETLRNWERGRRWPQGPARALLRIAAADPDVVAAVLVKNRASWTHVDPNLGGAL